jgi:ABC-type sugar transport system ATPase subunit
VADISFDDVTKAFPGAETRPALSSFSLDVAEGEFMILVGPSGCGKTTALRLVAGLERPTAGTIRIGGVTVNDLSPRERDVAMVFQNYALYPHMTVHRNLAFGLRQHHVDRADVERRVRDISAMLELDDLLKRRPAQLSGGQRQRVAMGRALVREPKVFLLDEPLSNLDAKLRVQMRAELKRLHRRLGITTIYVTHDQTEAMTLGERIAVMSEGTIQQLGSPEDVYERPANLFVAGFIGSPSMNFVRGVARAGALEAGDLRTSPPAGTTGAGVRDGDVVIGIRPEALRPVEDSAPGLDIEVDVVEPLGDGVLVHGTTNGTNGVTGVNGVDGVDGVDGRTEIIARLDPTLRPAPGSRIRLGVDAGRVHVFDPATGLALR